MSTGIFVKIKIHPFYQDYLRNHYQQSSPVFKFPRRDWFLYMLERFLTLPPKNTEIRFDPGEGPDVMRIEIPKMEYKDPFYYNYISKNSNDYIRLRIIKFVKHLIFDQIYELRRKGFTKEETIHIIMQENNINENNEDMIKKFYQRALNTERQRKFKKRKKNMQKSYQ